MDDKDRIPKGFIDAMEDRETPSPFTERSPGEQFERDSPEGIQYAFARRVVNGLTGSYYRTDNGFHCLEPQVLIEGYTNHKQGTIGNLERWGLPVPDLSLPILRTEILERISHFNKIREYEEEPESYLSEIDKYRHMLGVLDEIIELENDGVPMAYQDLL